MLAEACAEAGEPGALLDLISGFGEVPSASPSWDLWRLSRLANASPQVSALLDQGVKVVMAALPGATESSGRHPAVTKFAEALDGFLADFGQRGPNEWDIRAISWEAGPDQVLALVDSMRHMPDQNSPDARHERLEATRMSTAERIRAALPGADAEQGELRVALLSSARTIPLRGLNQAIAVTAINEAAVGPARARPSRRGSTATTRRLRTS